ncbi:hypothetical protein [Brevundimonas sp. RM1]
MKSILLISALVQVASLSPQADQDAFLASVQADLVRAAGAAGGVGDFEAERSMDPAAEAARLADWSAQGLEVCSGIAAGAAELRLAHNQAFVDLGAAAAVIDALPLFEGATDRDKRGLAEVRRQAIDSAQRDAETVSAIGRVAKALDHLVEAHCRSQR